MIIIVKIPDPPKNVLDPIELRKYLDTIRRETNKSGDAVNSQRLVVETTETAGGAYTANEQDMLNNLKSDVAHIMSALNALIDSLEGIRVIQE